MPSGRILATLLVAFLLAPLGGAQSKRPNVVLLMTDDQGIGDFGSMGNKLIETPHLDAMAGRSVSFGNFYVSPVCSPTRACLLTGRYNYRTRVVDTWLGRSMLEPAEVTIAEVLHEAGYATGIFGKWHLGDCYPLRPMEQGFEESLVHRGGGLAQPSEPRENQRRYTDPILFHNGEPVQTQGFCTDVYFDAAFAFLDAAHQEGRPFFLYLATNAPHSPFHDVPEELRQHYATKDMTSLLVTPPANAQRAEVQDRHARIAAMITNTDHNIGRLFERLDALGVTENTLVLYLNDNGPNSRRYVGELRGQKGEVFEGGVRSPLWLHWPGRLPAGLVRTELAAHIDLMPTILDACEVAPPADVALDGRSLWPLLHGQGGDWSERFVVIQSHRGDVPQRYHNFLIRQGPWKLVHPSGFSGHGFDAPSFELYDLEEDPGESRNLANEQTATTARLLGLYDQWFDDVSSTRSDNYAPPLIQIGSAHEKTTVLTRQDQRKASGGPDDVGHWAVEVVASASYQVQLLFETQARARTAEFHLSGVHVSGVVPAGADAFLFEEVELPAGAGRVEATITHYGNKHGAYQVIMRRR